MKKIDGGKLEEMRASEENKEVFKKFLDPLCKNPFIMAIPASSEKIKFQLEVPTADQIKKKVVLCQRISRPPQGEDFVVDESNVKSELLFMEVNKAILENLFSLCNDVYMPVSATRSTSWTCLSWFPKTSWTSSTCSSRTPTLPLVL
jgi:hypothetical protein